MNKTKTITLLALFTALSIVLGKYLAVNLTGSYRISFENLPVILAGTAFGPIAGAVVGITADLIGCILVGYNINPIITAGAAAIGIIAGVFGKMLLKRVRSDERARSSLCGGISLYMRLFVSVGTAHLIGSVIIKTIGIYYFFPQPFLILLSVRAAIYLFTTIAESFVLYILYRRAPMLRAG